MWSGGLESTALLYKALVEEKDSYVHAHHITQIERNSRRHLFESRAVDRLYPMLAGIRHFELSRTMIDYKDMLGPLQTEDVCLLWASSLVNALPTKSVQVYYGINKDDYGKLVLQERHSRRSLQQGFDYFCKNRYGKEISFVTPLGDMTKEDIWLYLPVDFRKLTHSCRYPLNTGRRCRKCEPCSYLNKIEKKHLQGV